MLLPAILLFDSSLKNKIWHIVTTLHCYTVTKVWYNFDISILYEKDFQGTFFCWWTVRIDCNAYHDNYTFIAKWHKLAAHYNYC